MRNPVIPTSNKTKMKYYDGDLGDKVNEENKPGRR